MTHHAPSNGLDPGDRMPGTGADPLDEMDELMSDWSWRERGQRDPGYVYTEAERRGYEIWQQARAISSSLGVMPALRPWSFPAYTGVPARPPRIGG